VIALNINLDRTSGKTITTNTKHQAPVKSTNYALELVLSCYSPGIKENKI